MNALLRPTIHSLWLCVLAPGVAERLRRASAGDLETWADQVLDANTLDDVFRVSRRKPAP